MSGAPGETTLRLFVALELSEAVRHGVRRWAASELSPTEGLRVLDEEALHVTLCFLGATPASELDAIGGACRDAVAGYRPPRLSLGPAIALPRRRPRVVAVEVAQTGEGDAPGPGREGSAGALAQLQAALAARLAGGGWYRPEARPFRAHVTVARVRAQSRIDARALERLPPIDMPPFAADTVTLFRSRTRPGGAQYEALARVRLAGV